MGRATLKGVILTLNEARHIQACAESLAWTDGVVVLDSHSTDGTQSLARATGAEVMEHRFENYAQQRNVALDAVNAEWILFVDADERATPALAKEVRQLIDCGGFPATTTSSGTACAPQVGTLITNCGYCAAVQLITMTNDTFTRSSYWLERRDTWNHR